MEKQVVKIYCLYEPHTCKIRYIGRTRNKLKRRMSQHLSKARNNYSNSHKENWIRNLLKNGITPKIKLLTKVEMTWKESHLFEKEIIQRHLKKHNLVNGDDRGPGNLGKVINKKNEEERVKKIKEFFNKEENKKNFYNKIFCYDSQGKFFKEYESRKFAAEELNICNTKLGNHLSRSKTSLPNPIKGFHFRGIKKDQIKVSEKYQENHVKIVLVNKDTNKEIIFKTIESFKNNFELGHWDIHQLRKNIKTKRIKQLEILYNISPQW